MDGGARAFFKSERDRLGMTQEQVAEKSGIRQGMISRLEIDPDYDPGIARSWRKRSAG